MQNAKQTHFDKWLYFLKHLDSFESIPEILNEPIFIEAFKSAEVANFTEEEYRIYEHSLMVMRGNVINTAREEGKIEGKIEIATEMILDGELIGKIMKYSKLTESEITDLKNKNNIVSRTEFDVLVKDFETQKSMANKYRELYENLRNKCNKERDNLINKVKSLEEQLDGSEIKLNARNAGRKAYSNQEVIEMIYNFYLEGKSLQGIANELNSSEIKLIEIKSGLKVLLDLYY